MRPLVPIACLALGACLARPALDPVGGFELVDAPARTEWRDCAPRELQDLLDTARARIATITDYSARLETRERIEGELFPRRVMELRIRHHPFSAAAETTAPPEEKGQRVWFDASANRGKLLAETPGFLGSLVGRVSLDPRGDLAMENRRHPITDIGLLRLIEQVEEGFEPALHRRLAPRIRATDVAGSALPLPTLHLVEALVARDPPDPPHCYRLGFDPASGLLVYYGLAELLSDGPALIEEYLYLDVVPNLGLTDEAFRPAR